MNAEMKYVVVSSPEYGEQLVMFPKSINHNAMVESLSRIRYGTAQDWQRVYAEPVSAGFTDGINCYGRSESLHLDARPGLDTALLKNGGQG
jgi:hypothetical protein